jgi:hypothetical protein
MGFLVWCSGITKPFHLVNHRHGRGGGEEGEERMNKKKTSLIITLKGIKGQRGRL